ncbi:MAG: hypothetical protein NC419_11130 [Muribaculaceae bacterium]|nr:hypothetical protein [Muribaculaceae bacterium]
MSLGGGDSYLEIRNIDQKIKNVYLNIWTTKEEARNVLTVRLNMTDEGSRDAYGVNNRVISSFLGKCNYISIYPYGILKTLKLTFPYEEGTTIEVKDIVFNQPVPMFFSFERILVMCLLYLIIRALFFSSYDTYYQPDSKKQIMTSGLILFLSITIVFPLTLVGNDSSGLATMDEYTDLTHALAIGNVYLDGGDVDERLLSAENPYDRAERRSLGIEKYKWDYVYYNGKIYVYFGVAPVILTYLPYYLLTDTDLAHEIPYMLFLISLMIGTFMLVNALVQKFCSKMPLKLYYLFQVTFMLGVGTLIFAKRICIYNMAIMAAVDFTVWGLYFWLRYSIKYENCKKWMVPAGSLCMALVAGCRPQLLMASALALPIFAEHWNTMCKDIKKKNIGRHLLLFAAFCIPYIVVAAFLMWYNAARFDSPFDFGAAYNLTTNDMTKRGSHIARLIPGIWTFLFQPASVNIEFPYISTTQFQTAYQGRTIYEGNIGGIFTTNVILLPCFLIYRCRAKLKEKKALLFTSISLIGAFIIVCADVQMSGILTRYIADFSILFYLAAFIIMFIWIDGYYTSQNTSAYKISETTWCRGIAVLCFITILYLILSVFALYVAGDYNVYRPVWYYHMKELWGLFDV